MHFGDLACFVLCSVQSWGREGKNMGGAMSSWSGSRLSMVPILSTPIPVSRTQPWAHLCALSQRHVFDLGFLEEIWVWWKTHGICLSTILGSPSLIHSSKLCFSYKYWVASKENADIGQSFVCVRRNCIWFILMSYLLYNWGNLHDVQWFAES